MKQSNHANPTRLLPVLFMLALSPVAAGFANSITVGGSVAEIQSIAVFPVPGSSSAADWDAPVEVAEIEIDNNLRCFELALNFADSRGSLENIATVTLVRQAGSAGHGLAVPEAIQMKTADAPGRFLWQPSCQGSATLGLRMKVIVTYASPPVDPPRLWAGFPIAL
jgi:hypothetical protein